MMDRETALSTLRLSADASRTDILTAFSRLARRYPLQQFPERHARLLEAKTALLSPELVVKNILFEDRVDVAWLNRYPKEGQSNEAAARAEHKPMQLQIEAMFRPHLKRGLSLFPVGTSFGQEVNRLFDELGPDDFFDELSPDDLLEMMEKFGL